MAAQILHHAAAQIILVALVAATAWAYEERPATADVARSTERAADAHVDRRILHP